MCSSDLIVHAIGAGVMIAEIQQMSDATFRVFDWNRVGADGKPRQLHVAEALESTDFGAGPVDPIRPVAEPIPGGTRERLSSSDFFALERLRLSGPSRIGRDDRFTIVIGLGGELEFGHDGATHPVRFGETLLLPAVIGACEVVPVGGEATVITCIVP